MLESALQLEPGFDDGGPDPRVGLAWRIEAALCVRHDGSTNDEYRRHVRNVTAALTASPTLRRSVLGRKLSPVALAACTPEELKPPEVAEADRASAEYMVQAAIALPGQPNSSEVCPRCRGAGYPGGKSVHEHELQTRSADEAMTRFLRCVSCGWARKS